jgi:ATP-dependent DNA helicase RecQ
VLLYSPGDAHTWARLRGKDPWPGAEAGFRALRDYAWGTGCREAAIVRHFTGEPGIPCGRCDACVEPAAVAARVERVRAEGRARREEAAARRAREDAVSLDACQLDTVVAFVDALRKPVGRRLVAQGLRGSRARAVLRKKLDDNPHFGALRGVPESALFRAMDDLLEAGRLAPRGRKYPTLWIPDKRVRPKRAPAPRPRSPEPPLRAARRAWRRKEARRRRWKAYQVFPDATLDALVLARPATPADLLEIPGLGPKRIARFSEAILRICSEYGSGS